MAEVRYLTNAYFRDAMQQRERMRQFEQVGQQFNTDRVDELAAWVTLGIVCTACLVVWGLA